MRLSGRGAAAGDARAPRTGPGVLHDHRSGSVLYLTKLGRDCPEMPCDAVFAEEEWRAVYLVTQRRTPPEQPPSLDTMVRMLATLGGFLNRKSDGFPGPETIWIGLQRAADFVLALRAQRAADASDG